MAKPGPVARSWGRFVEYMNEPLDPKPLTAEERKAARASLQRSARFTAEETHQLDDEALRRVRAMISTPPGWRTYADMLLMVLVIVFVVQVIWQLLGTPGPSIIASSIAAIAAVLYNVRRSQRPRFTDAYKEFGDAGMRLVRAVGRGGHDQSVLKRNATRAATDWRRLGPPLGADVVGQIHRVLELIGPDRTLPLPRNERDEIEAMVRATLVQAAHHAAQN